jgi:hypothetical protein
MTDELPPRRSSAHDFVRPFVITGGRTRASDASLRFETMVQTVDGARRGNLTFEDARIVECCEEPHSVAEVASYLGIPVGVAMVLIGDLIAQDCLEESHPHDDEIELSTIVRMIDRVRAL